MRRFDQRSSPTRRTIWTPGGLSPRLEPAPAFDGFAPCNAALLPSASVVFRALRAKVCPTIRRYRKRDCSVSAIDVQFGKASILRRSQRVCVSVDVVVLWRQRNDRSTSEKTKTLIVSAHGALIPLRTAVEINQVLTLRNAITNEDLACRVIDLSSLDQLGMRSVSVEFIQPATRFWHIAFPPPDWSARSPEAKGYKPQSDSHPKESDRKGVVKRRSSISNDLRVGLRAPFRHRQPW